MPIGESGLIPVAFTPSSLRPEMETVISGSDPPFRPTQMRIARDETARHSRRES